MAVLDERFEKHGARVHVLGPMVLYQATLPLLGASPNPKFIVLGSRSGVMGIEKRGSAGYGQSKAGVHFLVSELGPGQCNSLHGHRNRCEPTSSRR